MEFSITTATGDLLNTVEAPSVEEARRTAEGLEYEVLDAIGDYLIGRDLTAWHPGAVEGHITGC